MPDTDEVLKRSVTQDDYVKGAYAGGVYHYLLPMVGGLPDLPPFWSYARDWILYSTIYRESMWAAAVYIAVTKQASKSWEVESDVPQRQKRAQQLFLHFDNNRGWTSGMSKHLQAYCLTGNGGPVEIVRASSAAGSRVIGLVPLDPFRTIRTGDADIPYLYRDRRGAQHELRDYDAFCITDQPDLMDLWYGVGHCSAERAYKAIEKQEAIERYISEKVSGKRSLALDFIAGVMPDQVKQAQETAKNESAAKGVFTYMGSTIIPLMGDIEPKHVRVNLAELPDGFQRKEEFDLTVLTYARSLGIPVQDLQPLSGQGLGTGAQSTVLEESAKGQGMATWPKAFGHFVNEFALDDKTTFYFRENDIRDREREAKLRIDEAMAVQTWVTMQAITIEQARQLGVDRDQLPAEFIPIDETPGGTLSDSEKPVDEADVTPEDTALPVVQETEQPAQALVSEPILKDAKRIYDAIVSGNGTGDNNPRYDTLIDNQTKLIDALVATKSTPTDTPTMAESLRKAIDIAWTRNNEPNAQDAQLAIIKAQLDNAAQASDVNALNETLAALATGTLSKHNADMRALRGVLDEIRDAHKAQQGELISLKNSMVTLAAKDIRVTVSNDAKAMRKLAQDVLDLSGATFKHASDLTVKQEIIEMDKNGLALKVRRTLADGSSQDFRVLRNGGGRIKALELIA